MLYNDKESIHQDIIIQSIFIAQSRVSKQHEAKNDKDEKKKKTDKFTTGISKPDLEQLIKSARIQRNTYHHGFLL